MKKIAFIIAACCLMLGACAQNNQNENQGKENNMGKRSRNPLKRMMPDVSNVNYISLLTRASSLMIRQNSKLMVELMKPDILGCSVNQVVDVERDLSKRVELHTVKKGL